MALLGYVLQRTVIQGALDRGVLTTLLVTFGLSVVIENGLLQFFTANSRGLGTGLALVRTRSRIGSQIQIAYLLVVIFAVAVVVLLGLQYFLSASKYGRLIRAVADDQEASSWPGLTTGTCSASRRRWRSAPWRSAASPTACTPSSIPPLARTPSCCSPSLPS